MVLIVVIIDLKLKKLYQIYFIIIKLHLFNFKTKNKKLLLAYSDKFVKILI